MSHFQTHQQKFRFDKYDLQRQDVVAGVQQMLHYIEELEPAVGVF